ncbi:MAG: calcium-binding protein [Inquilinus sp.]|uniref:calcium-binding protein n=1 Tax=Inquilinus sp. TaxID=1932117 RepID=UPI003F349303
MAIITGDDFDNSLNGTAEADVIHGLGGNDSLFGNDGDDQLFGEDGNDVLAAGFGRDVLSGGAGDDSIFIAVDGGAGDGDGVDGGAGTDFLYLQFDDRFTAPITLSIADPGIEQVLSDGTRITGIERLQFRAGAGDDTIAGGDLADVLLGGAGTDSIQGGGGNDDLSGAAGSDTIDGGAGLDTLSGGAGNDALFGGADADTLHGNAGDDVLHGGDGNDALYGDDVPSEAGFDTLYGDGGDDVLRGGPGTAELHGGTGDDHYLIIRFGQTVVEAAGEGIDTVETTFSFRLPDNVENLVLDAALYPGAHAIGNALENVITGNDMDALLYGAAGNDTLHGGTGSDRLDGGLGADTMDGGAGDDTYVVGSSGDVVTELADQGTDTVRSAIGYHLGDNVEDLVLIGSRAVDGTGNDLANALTGNDAANVLAGGLGKDVLTGGGGADSFVFDTAFGGSNIDRLTDFTPAEDHFLLDPAIFSQLPPGALSPEAFALGTAAAEADDRILYDIDTGTLRYDRDGTGPGAARAFAIVVPGTDLSASDFLIG